jgi:hypothetical protein
LRDAAFFLTCTLTMGGGCADPPPAPVSVIDEVYFVDAHDTSIEIEPGHKFAVALAHEDKVAKMVRRDPRRPRVDGKILTLREMGSIPEEWREGAGGDGNAYVFEALEEGRSKVVVFDAAHREMFKLNVVAGDPAAAAKKARVTDTAQDKPDRPTRPLPAPVRREPVSEPEAKDGAADGVKPAKAHLVQPPSPG